MAVDRRLHKLALKALRESLRGLNMTTRVCSECGLTVYENRDEQKMYVETLAMIRKLNAWVANPKHGGEHEKKGEAHGHTTEAGNGGSDPDHG
jgi:hypothetical protein